MDSTVARSKLLETHIGPQNKTGKIKNYVFFYAKYVRRLYRCDNHKWHTKNGREWYFRGWRALYFRHNRQQQKTRETIHVVWVKLHLPDSDATTAKQLYRRESTADGGKSSNTKRCGMKTVTACAAVVGIAPSWTHWRSLNPRVSLPDCGVSRTYHGDT